MDAARAYVALVHGLLHHDYRPAYLTIRHRVLHRDEMALVDEGCLTPEDLAIITAARAYRHRIEPTIVNGIETFASIHDLLLYHEPIHLTSTMRGVTAFRGQLRSDLMLVPRLLRKPWEIERTKLAARALVQRPHSPRFTAMQVLAVLQHYGFATPFLDFTTNMGIAAAFACRHYTPSFEGQYGMVVKVSGADYRDLVPNSESCLGKRLFVEANEVPRIRKQEALFFAGYRIEAFELLTKLTRYLFRHGPESATFPVTTGLTESILFPPEDQLETFFNGLSARPSSGISACQQQVYEEVCSILDASVADSMESPGVGDYLELARQWVPWERLTARSRREIEVLCRWFVRLQELDIPPVCKSLWLFCMGVEDLAIDRLLVADDATDIWSRLKLYGGEQEAPAIRELFRQVRAEFPSLM